jgi:hypothetical protein
MTSAFSMNDMAPMVARARESIKLEFAQAASAAA